MFARLRPNHAKHASQTTPYEKVDGCYLVREYDQAVMFSSNAV
jgi:hypothetical protein